MLLAARWGFGGVVQTLATTNATDNDTGVLAPLTGLREYVQVTEIGQVC